MEKKGILRASYTGSPPRRRRRTADSRRPSLRPGMTSALKARGSRLLRLGSSPLGAAENRRGPATSGRNVRAPTRSAQARRRAGTTSELPLGAHRPGDERAQRQSSHSERAGTWTSLSNTNVLFSHPSELCPQKDGRKVRSRDEGTFTLGIRRWRGTSPLSIRRREATSTMPIVVNRR